MNNITWYVDGQGWCSFIYENVAYWVDFGDVVGTRNTEFITAYWTLVTEEQILHLREYKILKKYYYRIQSNLYKELMK